MPVYAHQLYPPQVTNSTGRIDQVFGLQGVPALKQIECRYIGTEEVRIIIKNDSQQRAQFRVPQLLTDRM